MPRPAPHDDRGQAAVELVVLLPLLAAFLALCWQLVLVGHVEWAATMAARAAAREAAIGGDPGAAARARLPAALEHGLRLSDRTPGEVAISLPIPRVVAGLPLGRIRATGRFRPQEPSP